MKYALTALVIALVVALGIWLWSNNAARVVPDAANNVAVR